MPYFIALQLTVSMGFGGELPAPNCKIAPEQCRLASVLHSIGALSHPYRHFLDATQHPVNRTRHLKLIAPAPEHRICAKSLFQGNLPIRPSHRHARFESELAGIRAPDRGVATCQM
jgi:hypothetical protein